MTIRMKITVKVKVQSKWNKSENKITMTKQSEIKITKERIA